MSLPLLRPDPVPAPAFWRATRLGALPCAVLVVSLLAGLAARVSAQDLPLPPGAVPCPEERPADYGSFLVVKSTLYQHVGLGGVSETLGTSSRVLVELVDPPGLAFSDASLSGPGTLHAALEPAGIGTNRWVGTYESEDRMNFEVRPGPGIARLEVTLGNTRPFAGYFPFTLASVAAPPVPWMLNLNGLESWDPRTAFTLQWIPWGSASTNDRLRLVIVDSQGQTVFSAGTDCTAEVSLPATAGSVDIPAGKLATQTAYTFYLTFGTEVMTATDRSVRLVERGIQSRTTRLSVKTAGPLAVSEGVLSEPHLSATGDRLILRLAGTPRIAYRIEWSADLIHWELRTSLTLPISGRAEISLPLATDGGLRFWRARVLDPSLPDAAAVLKMEPVSPQFGFLTIRGLPGYSYRIEASPDLRTWFRYNSNGQTIPAGTNQIRVPVFLFSGSDFYAYRAVTVAP